MTESTLDLLVKAGPLGIVVLLVVSFGVLVRWLVNAFLKTINEQRTDGVAYAEAQRETFLEHNKTIAESCEQSTKAIVASAVEAQRVWMVEWLPKILKLTKEK